MELCKSWVTIYARLIIVCVFWIKDRQMASIQDTHFCLDSAFVTDYCEYYQTHH